MNTAVTERPIIAMDAVESSQIAAIGHHEETQTLAIKFPPNKSGQASVYHYGNFSAEQFAEFKNAESKGSHFGKFIKPFKDQFPYENVTDLYANEAAVIDESIAPTTQDSLFVTVPERTLPKCEQFPEGLFVPAFLVAKYLASANDDGKLYISATDKPVVNISFYDAIKAADEAEMPMITDPQYLSMALNIVEQPENWKSGIVGEGDLYRGLHKGSVSGAQRNDYESPDPDERRWFVLSTGERVFDPSGHLYTWCRSVIEGDPETGLVNRPFAEDSPNITTSPYPSMEKGVGWMPDAGDDWSGYALARGGCWDSGDHAGVFRLGDDWPGYGGDHVGVRCTKLLG